jgi:carbon storage regulator CsrA
MLVLSRKLNEEICIGDDIVIRIVEVRRSRVRIGIFAPPDVRIRREEVSPEGEMFFEMEIEEPVQEETR